MQALSCPKCGAPLQAGTSACPYCRVGFYTAGSPVGAAPGGKTPAEGARSGAAPAVAIPVPAEWVLHKDPWHGFTIAHPPDWQVVTLHGQIGVREDPIGAISAWIWPFIAPGPTSATQVANHFVQLAHSLNPSFQAWQQPVAVDSSRVSVKTHQTRFGQQLEGYFNILVNGTQAIISGYEAPTQLVAQRSAVFSQILSTFSTSKLMPRQVAAEPAERAFSVTIPQGWAFQAGVNRNHVGGSGSLQFSCARDGQGTVNASMPSYVWFYMEGGMGGFFSVPGGPEALAYMPAAQFASNRITGWMSQFQQGMKVEAITDRPDLAELGVLELMKAGYSPTQFEVSCAILESTSTFNGVRLRQKSRVNVQRQRNSGPAWMGGGSTVWTAGLDVFYHAPEAEFAAWEPVLAGILDSLKISPAWQAGERNLANNFIQNSQNDIRRRTQQISQTLRETSEIVNNSYWDRQASYDRISEQRSNVTLGYQDMAAPSGEVYKVPSGHEQYWVNGLGEVYGGSWLTQPDINWQPLNPTGI